jgi:hypothetical protein
MEQEIGYKVLTIYRKSAIVSRVSRKGQGKGTVYYPPHKKVVPNSGCGPLCIFTKLSQAMVFKKIQAPSGIVVKCNYEKSLKNHIWIFEYLSISFLPRGTILADSVTCLE